MQCWDIPTSLKQKFELGTINYTRHQRFITSFVGKDGLLSWKDFWYPQHFTKFLARKDFQMFKWVFSNRNKIVAEIPGPQNRSIKGLSGTIGAYCTIKVMVGWCRKLLLRGGILLWNTSLRVHVIVLVYLSLFGRIKPYFPYLKHMLFEACGSVKKCLWIESCMIVYR